jgi:hypothetical protein
VKLISNGMNRDSGAYKTALLAALVALVAAQSAGAAATSVVASMNSTSPGGFIFDGTRNWVSDNSLGFCRMDPAGGAGGFTLTNCVKPLTSNPAVPVIVGQPAFDPATGFLYLPDMSTASLGIWRYKFNGTTFNTPVNIAAAAGLGAQRPGAVAFSSDGSIYVSMTANSSIQQVTTPAAAGTTQTAASIGTTVSGLPATGIAMVGVQLWVTDFGGRTPGVVVFTAPATCAGAPCKGVVLITFGVASPLSIGVDNLNSLAYIGTSSGVFRRNLLTGLTDLYASSYTKAGVPGLFSHVSAVGVDGVGNLQIVEDPSGGQVAGGATMFTVPAGSAPQGQGTIPTPLPTVPPAISVNAIVNPASLFSKGLTAPNGAVFLPTPTGGHIWVSDGAHGFCKVNPTLAAPGLTPCAVLPVGFVPGPPAFDPTGKFVYLADTAAAAGILRFPFNSTTETLGAGVPVVTNAALVAAVAGATGPTALAFGPDNQLYVAMAGVADILRVTAPATATHTTRSIGQTNQVGTVSIGFYKADLYDAEATNASIIRSATLCFGTCTAQFLPATLSAVTAIAADANFVYIGDADQFWRFDPVANVLALMADTGLLNGTPTAFGAITGVAIDTAGNVFAIDQSGPIWSLSTAQAVITTLSPAQAPETAVTAVTITGANFVAPLVVSTCPAITASNVVVVSPTQITTTFSINPLGPVGACAVTVSTAAGASVAKNFTVLIGPPVLITITPATGLRGRIGIPVSIAGVNMTSGVLSPMADITFSAPVVTDTLITTNFTISPTAVLGTRNVIVTSPTGASNILTFTIAAATPVLTSINPAQGVAATTVPVVIAGTDLFQGTLNLPTGFTVAATPAAVFTNTSITASLVIASTVPAGLQSITVTTPGVGNTSNAVTFNILPALTSIATTPPTSPTQARAGDTTAVTLTGTSLVGVTSINAGVNITVTNLVVVSATQITATFTSAPSAPVGPVSVTVTGTSGTSPSPVTFTLIGPIPVIANIAPATGVRGTTVPITITGTGLTLGTINLPVGITLSGTPGVSFTTITASLVIATDAPLGAQSITVTTPGTGNLSNAFTFTVTAPVPTLTSVAPATGTAGTTVATTFTGTGLVGGTLNLPTGITILAGTTPVVASTGLSITASLVIASTVPAGLQSITVTTPGGTSTAVTINITPVLTTIATTPATSPAQARAGASTTITFTGTSLSGTGATTINAGANITVTNIVATVNSITATFTSAPAAPVGPVSVTVTVAGNTSNALTFTLTGPLPVITSISPATGGTGATVPVTITGTGLTLGTLNLPVGISLTGAAPVVSFTQITATLLIAGNAPLGAQTISVTTPGTGNTSNAFTFTVFALAPTLTSVAPTTGVAGTNVTVTLTGTGLTGTSSVNTTAASNITVLPGFTVLSPTQISATLVIPANASTTQITVTNVNGTSNSVTFGIVPTLASISPNTGVAGKSVPVTLTGTSFTGATSINASAAGITVTNLVVVSSTQITATLGIATTATQGTGTITVTTPGGTTNTTPFTVLPPTPVITSLNNTAISKRSSNVGMNVNGTNLGNLPISSFQVLLTTNGVVTPASVTITGFTPSQTQIRFNWTFLAAAPISDATHTYTVTVTTPSGTSNAFPFTVTN